jgi:hypothetical protein
MAEVDVLVTTRLSTLTCGNCHIPFAIPDAMHLRVKQNGAGFWCPNGHNISYSKTENARLREQLERERRTVANLSDDLRVEKIDHATTKGQLTKTRNRIARGVCPHCKRTFANVARHMTSKHPETEKRDSRK